jgi:hypothetical protein
MGRALSWTLGQHSLLISGSAGCHCASWTLALPLGSVRFAMADTTKLSVGKALEKLRGTDEPKSKMTRLDEKIDDLDKETQRRSLAPGKKGEPTKRD